MIDRRALLLIATLASAIACGSRTPLGEPAPAGDDGDGGGGARNGTTGAGRGGEGGGRDATSTSATDGPTTDVSSTSTGGPGPTPVNQCLCPDEPGFAPCELPFMCCPCGGTCENPDTFNCSCEHTRECL